MIDMQFIIFAGLALMIVGALFYVFAYKSIETQKKANQRVKSFQVDRKVKVKDKMRKMDEKQRRKMREESLKLVDAQKKEDAATKKPGLHILLSQAGMNVTPKTFYTYSVVFGLVVFVALFIFARAPIYVAAGAAFVAGMGLPKWFVGFKRNRRIKAFTKEFPNAVDIIVRGIKSGLPLNDCMRIIANDAEEPVRSEFKKILEANQMGLTMPDAIQRLYQNVPSSETNFFAIVIAIQASAGGNLSEALGNLSKVLRERRKMADKIKTASAEANASAMIVGFIPIGVAIAMAVVQPGYLQPLFETDTGNKILVVCAVMYATGIGIMKKMVNFKF